MEAFFVHAASVSLRFWRRNRRLCLCSSRVDYACTMRPVGELAGLQKKLKVLVLPASVWLFGKRVASVCMCWQRVLCSVHKCLEHACCFSFAVEPHRTPSFYFCARSNFVLVFFYFWCCLDQQKYFVQTASIFGLRVYVFLLPPSQQVYLSIKGTVVVYIPAAV